MVVWEKYVSIFQSLCADIRSHAFGDASPEFTKINGVRQEHRFFFLIFNHMVIRAVTENRLTQKIRAPWCRWVKTSVSWRFFLIVSVTTFTCFTLLDTQFSNGIRLAWTLRTCTAAIISVFTRGAETWPLKKGLRRVWVDEVRYLWRIGRIRGQNFLRDPQVRRYWGLRFAISKIYCMRTE